MSNKRIMIIGCGGSGKSTFSRQLHEVTKIDVFHLDKYFWKPNWVERGEDEWKEKVNMLSNKASWIIEGNYGGTMEVRFQKAEVIIFMDRSRWTCLYRVIKRVLKYHGRTRSDMGEGCKEYLSWKFMVYIFFYNQNRRPGILKRLEELRLEKKVVILNSNKVIKEYLKSINL